MKKVFFTPGPADIPNSALDILPCFGRADADYQQVKKYVMDQISVMVGTDKTVVSMTGSASLAIEVAIKNLIRGKVLVINTGYYSQRIYEICLLSNMDVDFLELENLNFKGTYDWVLACPVETASGKLTTIEKLKSIADLYQAKLMLDATGSIGLEKDHDLADVLAFSSCKGLFGLTGAAFVAFNTALTIFPNTQSFYLDLMTHINQKNTGPYHIIYSLYSVLKDHNTFKNTVIVNKRKALEKFNDYLLYPLNQQPLLCTALSKKIIPLTDNLVLYTPRDQTAVSVICHLGELNLRTEARGEILDLISFDTC
jgi:2-aminoethylphosphonate-pyruvate transaminase